jgi:hypothetical protein
MSEENNLSKVEILANMKKHQAEYAKYAAMLKEIMMKDELKAREVEQMKKLESYKAKYKFFVQPDGAIREIDWEEVEKLVKQSFSTGQGYTLGFNSAGDEGLAYSYENTSSFTPMAEDESDAKKLVARYERIKEFEARIKRRSDV